MTMQGGRTATGRNALSLALIALLLTACARPLAPTTPTPPPPAPAPYSLPDLDVAIERGIAFLRAQCDTPYGLCQESPTIGQRRYYLANDSLLAAHVLRQWGQMRAADRLDQKLAEYNITGNGVTGNGFIEVAWGEVIDWPPNHHRDVVVEPLEDSANGQCDLLHDGYGMDDGNPDPQDVTLIDCALNESHPDAAGYFYDWSAYSNLACMAAVNEFNAGHRESARRLYAMQLRRFDGNGWQDAAYWERAGEGEAPDKTLGVYETLGLAWCLYAAALTEAPNDLRLVLTLLEQQNPRNGGFHTHFQYGYPRQADPNVETTSIALLALDALRRSQNAHFTLEPTITHHASGQ